MAAQGGAKRWRHLALRGQELLLHGQDLAIEPCYKHDTEVVPGNSYWAADITSSRASFVGSTWTEKAAVSWLWYTIYYPVTCSTGNFRHIDDAIDIPPGALPPAPDDLRTDDSHPSGRVVIGNKNASFMNRCHVQYDVARVFGDAINPPDGYSFPKPDTYTTTVDVTIRATTSVDFSGGYDTPVVSGTSVDGGDHDCLHLEPPTVSLTRIQGEPETIDIYTAVDDDDDY